MYIGIDIGGTNARVGAAPILGKDLHFSKKEFVLSHNFDRDFSYLKKIIRESSQDKINAIAIGLPGDISPDKTTFISPSNNLAEWSNKEIFKLLNDEFHCPVILENDGVMGALGESHFTQKGENFTYIVWGTGIGGAKVHWENNERIIKKLDWYKYFKSWEEDCGGYSIKYEIGKSAKELNDSEWKIILDVFGKHFIEFCKLTASKMIIFGGGIAFEQKDKLNNYFKSLNLYSPQIQITSVGEDSQLIGAFKLLGNLKLQTSI